MTEDAPMRHVWLWKTDRITFTRPDLWMVLGIRGSGKSSFLERVAEQYLKHGATVFDFWGSADSEGLAWLRSPYRNDKQILLLTGEHTLVRGDCITKKAAELGYKDLTEYDIIINASVAYSSREEEYQAAERIGGMLYNRSKYGHRRLLCTMVRESASFFYSKLAINKSQHTAKSSMIYMLREARHNYIAMLTDALYETAVEREVRLSTNYFVIKKMGMMKLPRHLSWLYNPNYTGIDPNAFSVMPVNTFLAVTDTGAVAFGIFNEVPWHKQEKEHLPKALNLEFEYSRTAESAIVSPKDPQHADAVSAYAELGSMTEAASRAGISRTTVSLIVKRHNLDIETFGICPVCERSGSIYAREKISTNKAVKVPISTEPYTPTAQQPPQ